MLREAALLAWREITGNLPRSLLTTLGVVIGVAAVLAIVTTSTGLQWRITRDLNGVGGNLLTLRPGQARADGATTQARPFQAADVLALARDVTDIAGIAPIAAMSVMAVAGGNDLRSTIDGTNTQYLAVHDRHIVRGRSFDDGEAASGRPVCVVGETVRSRLFHDEEAVGASLRLGAMSCLVIGVLDSHGDALSDGEDDNLILAPLAMVQERLAGHRGIGLIQMTAIDAAHLDSARQQIGGLMRERRHTAQADDDFAIEDLHALREKLQRAFRVIGLTLGGVAGISLMVGGIGIMNIMLVSVSERTREIGTRLAIGALPADIRLQFLVEATVLSVIGGLAGLCLGLVLSLIFCTALGFPFRPGAGAILVSLGFAGLVGILFGFLPAQRAAGLPPAQAMRHE
jgi:putative ABC transport system permease protein